MCAFAMPSTSHMNHVVDPNALCNTTVGNAVVDSRANESVNSSGSVGVSEGNKQMMQWWLRNVYVHNVVAASTVQLNEFRMQYNALHR